MVNVLLEKHRGLSLVDENYIIRAFRGFDEMLNEGNVLRHAVVYYAKKNK